ncbi:polyprenyl diphosphate synthase [Teredinibacter waterburyi]|jgi:Undecaprenyl pyrophosphate synthetase (EC 2.5.1.31)|uniref:polyprenyl diphosphate synthase n=1 Tax=Teredinibacter waterburyi TaxID=1500538 RepID=UPI00165EEFFB|nr:polyprenyl diphosphate synthase [Teredinibacter waterburyi]
MDNFKSTQENPLRHVAIIMDGNNRWAKREGRQGIAGHKAGVERIRDVLRACQDEGVEALTLFAFSSENWRRPPKEVEALMGLFYSYLKKEARKLADENVALRVIGNRDRFDKKLLKAIDQAEAIASEGSATLVIAADYGGCWDIAQSARTLAEQVKLGALEPSAISEQLLTDNLSTQGLPPLDMLVRTGGEYRISNFLLWQAAYAELYFSPLLWPEFGADAMREAIEEFRGRQRRFGKTGEQLKQEAASA